MNKFDRTIGKKNDGLGNNKNRQDIAAKVAMLLGDFQKLAKGHNDLARFVQQEIDTAGNRLDDISVVLQAIATVVGTDKVNEAAKAIRIEMSEKDVASQDSNIANAVKEGKLKVIDTVTESCLLITTIVRPDGTQVYPRKSAVAFASLKPEIQALAKDKKVGDKFDLPTAGSGTMTILEIYEDVPEVEQPAEQPEA